MDAEKLGKLKSVSDVFIITKNPSMEFNFTWRIENFSKIIKNVESPIYEPIPGFRLRSTLSIEGNLLQIRFIRISCNVQTIGYKYDLSLLTSEGKVCKRWTTEGEYTESINAAAVYFRFYDGCPLRDVTCKYISKYFNLLDDVLTVKYVAAISCFAMESHVISMSQSFDCCRDLKNDLKGLLSDGLFADVTLCVDKESISAHKSILCTRSAVFAKMFQSEMREKTENSVTFVDIKFPVLKKLVEFIYAGETEDLTMDISKDLYRAADKYAVCGLKEICSRDMKSNLTVENVFEIYSMADVCNDELLKSFAKAFFLQNFSQATKTENWKMMVQGHPDLVSKLLSF